MLFGLLTDEIGASFFAALVVLLSLGLRSPGSSRIWCRPLG